MYEGGQNGIAICKVKTPAGEWNNAIQFTFESSCADAGITTMYFVPDIGPVVYETTSIAGPVRWELIYGRAGSAVVEASQVGFTVALDAPIYKKPDDANAGRLTLRNTHAQPVCPDVHFRPELRSADLERQRRNCVYMVGGQIVPAGISARTTGPR